MGTADVILVLLGPHPELEAASNNFACTGLAPRSRDSAGQARLLRHVRGGGARSRIAPRVFSTNSCEEFPKTSGEALNRRHRPVPIANELRRGIKNVRWASIGAIQLQGRRAAQAFAREGVVVSVSARRPKLCGRRTAATARS